jgi:hypothetical protein
MKKTYNGSCHCGRVTFELQASLVHVIYCNCSLCRRVGALWHGASESSLRIVSGTDDLEQYQFNTRTARHYFCKHCGVHPFSRPRLDPSRWAVNVRCIQDVDLEALEVKTFDGENWEAAAARLRTPPVA